MANLKAAKAMIQSFSAAAGCVPLPKRAGAASNGLEVALSLLTVLLCYQTVDSLE